MGEGINRLSNTVNKCAVLSIQGSHLYPKMTVKLESNKVKAVGVAVFIKQTAAPVILLMHSLWEFSGAISNTIKNTTLWQTGELCIKHSVVGK